MEILHERVLAYGLATTVDRDALGDISGGISINVPTYSITAQPLTPDVIFDS